MKKHLKIKKLHQDVIFPRYMSSGAAGFDISAFFHEKKELTIKTGKIEVIPTGLVFEIPVNYEAQIRPRSGLAFKHGISIVNSPGTIDSDYRGEVKVCLINMGEKDYTVKTGDRIAQVVLAHVPEFEIKEVLEISHTKRGDGGFGHTGS